MNGNGGRKKVDLVHVLLASIIALLLAVLTGGFQLYGKTIENGKDNEALAHELQELKESIEKLEIPPEWFKSMVIDNSEDITRIDKELTQHIARDEIR